MTKPSLRLRIAAAFAIVCISIVASLGYTLYAASEEMEDDLIEQIVTEELGFLIARYRAGLKEQIKQETDLQTFFAQSPRMHPNCALIKGVVCGVRVEEIEDPLMRNIRYLDKLIDELAKGKAMEKILRQ